MLNEHNRPFSTCIRCATCDGFPCLVHAKSDAEVLGVRPALEYPNVTLQTNSEVIKLTTNASGTTVTGVVVERNGQTETYHGRHRRRLGWCDQFGRTSAYIRQCQASGWACQWLRPGRAQLYVPQQRGGACRLERTQPDPVPEDARGERLRLWYGGFRVPDRQHPDGRQSQASMHKGEKPIETKPAPMFALKDIAHHAVDFWLSTEDLPIRTIA